MNRKQALLYVDDEQINLFLFDVAMRDHFHVLTALSGKDGLEILKENPDIKLVITDIKMPEMDGLEFIEMARERFGAEKHFFLMTALMKPQNEVDGIIKRYLVDGYFSKPFDKEEIIEVLGRFDQH